MRNGKPHKDIFGPCYISFARFSDSLVLPLHPWLSHLGSTAGCSAKILPAYLLSKLIATRMLGTSRKLSRRRRNLRSTTSPLTALTYGMSPYLSMKTQIFKLQASSPSQGHEKKPLLSVQPLSGILRNVVEQYLHVIVRTPTGECSADFCLTSSNDASLTLLLGFPATKSSTTARFCPFCDFPPSTPNSAYPPQKQAQRLVCCSDNSPK